MTEELAADGIGDALRTSHFLAPVQIEAIPVVVVAAQAFDKPYCLPALLVRHARQSTVGASLNGRQLLDVEHFHLFLLIFGQQKAALVMLTARLIPCSCIP